MLKVDHVEIVCVRVQVGSKPKPLRHGLTVHIGHVGCVNARIHFPPSTGIRTIAVAYPGLRYSNPRPVHEAKRRIKVLPDVLCMDVSEELVAGHLDECAEGLIVTGDAFGFALLRPDFAGQDLAKWTVAVAIKKIDAQYAVGVV